MGEMSIAWIAGIIEGEGCISVLQKREDYPVITVQMTDEDIITRLKNLTGVGTICIVTKKDPKHKQPYKWTVCGRKNVARILLAIYPLMGSRRQLTIATAVDRLLRPYRHKLVAECGTLSGRSRHLRLKEPVCDPCRIVANEYNKEFKRAKRKQTTNKEEENA